MSEKLTEKFEFTPEERRQSLIKALYFGSNKQKNISVFLLLSLSVLYENHIWFWMNDLKRSKEGDQSWDQWSDDGGVIGVEVQWNVIDLKISYVSELCHYISDPTPLPNAGSKE